MFTILFRLGIRNFIRQKRYSSINIIGLAIGLLSFILIMLYVQNEQSFDDFNAKRDQIYRLYNVKKSGRLAITPYLWGHTFKEIMPEVEHAVAIQLITSLTIKLEGNVFAEEGIVVSDSTFFNLFDYPVIQGDRAEFLRHPNQVVITPETAIKYFKGEDPMGKTLEISLWGTFVKYEIAGVVECPHNSHIPFNFLVPNHLVKRYFFEPPAYENWRISFVYTYLLMNDNIDQDDVQQKFAAIVDQHLEEEVHGNFFPKIEPLQDIYLKSDLKYDFQPRGNANNNWILTIVALGILIMAIINFINITSAQSLTRLKEVGLRKIFGSRRSTLVAQFICEATLTALISMVFSIFLLSVILPSFNTFTGKEFLLSDIFTWKNCLYFLSLVVGVGLVSGIYPAFLLSSFKPIDTLRSRLAAKAFGNLPRKVLVILQFGLAVVLLVCTGVIYQQVTYMQQKNLGFNKEQTISIFDAGQISKDGDKMSLLRAELLKSQRVNAVAASSTNPGQPSFSMKYLPDGFEDEEALSLSTVYADHDFLKTYDVEIVEGRDFDRTFSTDSNAILINQAATRFFASRDSSWLHQPLGKKIRQGLTDDSGGAEVIGVFKDYHHESFKKAIEPLLITIGPELFLSIQIKLSTTDLSQTLPFIENTWKQLFPEVPFNFKFIDQEFAQLYQSDQKLGAILQLFSILAIVVAMLGLFGLASFLAFEKAKEMSIRRVMGASEWQIIYLLSWLFLKLVLVANLIALPLSYLLMNRWLEAFAYQTDMPFYIFFMALGATVLVTILTIGFHAHKTATVNPVDMLSQE